MDAKPDPDQKRMTDQAQALLAVLQAAMNSISATESALRDKGFTLHAPEWDLMATVRRGGLGASRDPQIVRCAGGLTPSDGLYCHRRYRPPTDASEVGNVIEYPAGRPSSKDLHGRRQQRRRGPSGEHSPVPVSKALCVAHRHI